MEDRAFFFRRDDVVEDMMTIEQIGVLGIATLNVLVLSLGWLLLVWCVVSVANGSSLCKKIGAVG